MKSALAVQKANSGHLKNTRSQTTNTSGSCNNSASGTNGHLTESRKSCSTVEPSCSVSISDELAAMDAAGRCGDTGDDCYVSPVLAERAILKGIVVQFILVYITLR